MHINSRSSGTQDRMSTSYVEDPPNIEPSYLDRLYIQFGQGMTYSQHTMFQNLTRERKDYLFDLWLKKHGYV
jgi:uncharacterized membrane protein